MQTLLQRKTKEAGASTTGAHKHIAALPLGLRAGRRPVSGGVLRNTPYLVFTSICLSEVLQNKEPVVRGFEFGGSARICCVL